MENVVFQKQSILDCQLIMPPLYQTKNCLRSKRAISDLMVCLGCAREEDDNRQFVVGQRERSIEVSWFSWPSTYPTQPSNPASQWNNSLESLKLKHCLSVRTVQHNGRSWECQATLLISVLWTHGGGILHHHPRLPVPVPPPARLHIQDSVHRTPENKGTHLRS